MAWLAKLSSTANINAVGATPHYPFEDGRVYWQLDLDGRDAVEGLASFYQDNKSPGYFGRKIIEHLEKQRTVDMGSVAVYLANDGHADIAYAFIAEDANFAPSLP